MQLTTHPSIAEFADIDRLNEQAAQLERKAPAEMLARAQSAHQLAVAADYRRGATKSLTLIGKAYARLGNLAEADRFLTRAQDSDSLDPALACEICNVRGIIYIYLRVYDKAFAHYQKGLVLARQIGDRDLESRLLNNTGEIYREHKDFATALDYYRLSLEAQSGVQDFDAKSVPFANLAATYLELGDLANAELYAQQAIVIAREQNDQMVESVSLQYLGLVAKRRGRREQAIRYLSESLAIYRSTREMIHAAEVLIELHRLHFEAGEVQQSLHYLQTALTDAAETDSQALKAAIYAELAAVHESLGDVEAALSYHKQREQTMKIIEQEQREQRLRALGVQVAADESFREKEAYRTLSQELDRKARELETRSRELEEAYSALEAISDIGKSITATFSLDRIFALVHERLQDLMEIDAFGIGLYHPEQDAIEYVYLVEEGRPLRDPSVSLSSTTSFAVACFKRRKGILINSSSDDDISGYVERPASLRGTPMSAVMFQPLVLEEEAIGIISVQCRKENVYNEQTLNVLGTLAAYLSIAIQNARKSEKLREEIRQRELAQHELQRLNSELASLSNRDGLTSIANRRHFDEFLQHIWGSALRQQFPLSLLMIDVDCFKEYNDSYGHLSGDEVLKRIAQVLKKCAKRGTDLAARFGGDEFAVLLGDTGASGAQQVASDVQQALADCSIAHGASEICAHVTISIGVATIIPTRETQPCELVTRGDQALYQAKQTGRNRVCTFRE